MAEIDDDQPPFASDEFDDFEDEEEEFEFDCGMDSDGHCGYAGSEDCDFECPYRDMEEAANG